MHKSHPSLPALLIQQTSCCISCSIGRKRGWVWEVLRDIYSLLVSSDSARRDKSNGMNIIVVRDLVVAVRLFKTRGIPCMKSIVLEWITYINISRLTVSAEFSPNLSCRISSHSLPSLSVNIRSRTSHRKIPWAFPCFPTTLCQARLKTS